ncbi:MAG: hypothetical protein M0T81_03610 [Thermoplasmatales archaeon]|nr:hypothetical protein [Thermoplasmatales archaeon]
MGIRSFLDNLDDDAYNLILSDSLMWIESALEDLKVYGRIRQQNDISFPVSIEFIQRALEKAIKINVHFFKMILLVANLGSQIPFEEKLKEQPINESFTQDTLTFFGSVFETFRGLQDPKNLGHTPCNVMLKRLSKLVPNNSKLLRILENEKNAMDELISNDIVSRPDAELYFSYASRLRKYHLQVLKETPTGIITFDETVKRVKKLQENAPKDEFGLLVYAVIHSRLIHHTLTRIVTLTPMQKYESDLKQIDLVLAEIHNEMVQERMNSVFYKGMKEFFNGIFIISKFFPLCNFLGRNYTKLKYPLDSSSSTHGEKIFGNENIDKLNSFFISVAEDLNEALKGISLWLKS